MKKYEIVKSHEDFNEVMNKGEKCGNKYFLIFLMPNNELIPKFGIAVGKKLGNAVVRNKFKRQMRAIIDKNKFLFKNSYNYIIMVKRDCLNISYNELENQFVSLIRKEIHEK